MNKKNVCIIGAGLGGLAVGALLVKRGYQVKIYEREITLGGRALSIDAGALSFGDYTQLLSRFDLWVPFAEPALEVIFEEKRLKNYTLDLGFHLIGGSSKYVSEGDFTAIARDVEFMGSRTGYVYDHGFRFHFFSTFDKLSLLPRIIQLFYYYRESKLKSLDRVSIAESMKKFRYGKMTLALELFSRAITTVNDLDLISTGETLRSLKDLLHGTHSLGYPINGLGSLSKAFGDFIIKNGGKIIKGTMVDKIIVEDNNAKGVVINGAHQYSDVVISNIPVQKMFSIIDKKQFPTMYVKKIKKLEGTGSFCAYYSLRKIRDDRLIGKSFMFLEQDAGVGGGNAFGMIDFMTASHKSGLAPKNCHLVQSYVACTPQEARNRDVVEKLKGVLDKWLERLVPDFRDHLDWVIYPAVWHLDGVAKTINNEKPGIKTPVENLYLVGDCVKAPGIGVNCAVNSARMLADIL